MDPKLGCLGFRTFLWIMTCGDPKPGPSFWAFPPLGLYFVEGGSPVYVVFCEGLTVDGQNTA